MEHQIRLQKYMADCGVAGRRTAEALIAGGRVTVNGHAATLGTKITPTADEVRLDGVIILPKNGGRRIYLALHKPTGVITSAADQFGRKTVVDLVKDAGVRLYPVGRLDYASSGLILLTNDGEAANKIIHPRHGVEKVYEAKVAKALGKADAAAFKRGVVIDGRLTLPARLEILGQDKKQAEITLHEGRNRQIRKMFAVLGNEVISLKRKAIGPIVLGGLKSGEYRHLTAEEIEFIMGL